MRRRDRAGQLRPRLSFDSAAIRKSRRARSIGPPRIDAAKWVGASSIKAIVANRWVPGWLDRYLGRRGVDAQQDAHIAAEAQPSSVSHFTNFA
ncbi:hypothetical protein BN2476_470006 [Paraburkholderia piptadeniae]|uniref:Uncharacterized protein n=1 Tax=Paraburkholderia piptadeniae TaxID=1701573 RepID=A0A1N7SDJ1_9BURK|nr:hypothetical protein BN2476_470006 [Paraburkholderia piptadeniae]